jgi:hypothetical protein
MSHCVWLASLQGLIEELKEFMSYVTKRVTRATLVSADCRVESVIASSKYS